VPEALSACPDAEAERLELMAAEFHTRAIQAEFEAGSDSAADSFDEQDIENLRQLLGRTEVAAMFDETARELLGNLSAEPPLRANLAH
jgi:hypothetical protein